MQSRHVRRIRKTRSRVEKKKRTHRRRNTLRPNADFNRNKTQESKCATRERVRVERRPTTAAGLRHFAPGTSDRHGHRIESSTITKFSISTVMKTFQRPHSLAVARSNIHLKNKRDHGTEYARNRRAMQICARTRVSVGRI